MGLSVARQEGAPSSVGVQGGEKPPHVGFPIHSTGVPTFLPSVEMAERVCLRADGMLTTCQVYAGHRADRNCKDGACSWGLMSRQESHFQKQIPGLAQPDTVPGTQQGCPAAHAGLARSPPPARAPVASGLPKAA